MASPTATVPTPDQNPEFWSYLALGTKGRYAPGRVVAVSPKRAHDVDKKKGGGTSGATITTNGEKPFEIDITLEFYQGDDDVHDIVSGAAAGSHLELELERFQLLVQALFPGGEKAPDPFDVSNAYLALHNIRSLFFEEITGPTPSGDQKWTYTLKGTNFRPRAKAKSVTSTPTSSQPFGMANALTHKGGAAQNGPPPPPGWKPPTSPDVGTPKP